MVEVVNIRNVGGFGRLKGDVYIGRRTSEFPESVWANPFPIGNAIVNDVPERFTRDSCIQRYIKYLSTGEVVDVNGKIWDARKARDHFPELQQAKRLGCWCKPNPCHGDFLKKMIDMSQPQQQTLNTRESPSQPSFKVRYDKYVSPNDARFHPDSVYVFEDNDEKRMQRGGIQPQNTAGIRVKKNDGMSPYTDTAFEQNVRKIAEDLEYLGRVSQGKTIVFPLDGVGTSGMVLLDISAPETFKYLTMALKQMFNITNGNSEQQKMRREIASVPKSHALKQRFNIGDIKGGEIIVFKKFGGLELIGQVERINNPGDSNETYNVRLTPDSIKKMITLKVMPSWDIQENITVSPPDIMSLELQLRKKSMVSKIKGKLIKSKPKLKGKLVIRKPVKKVVKKCICKRK